VIRRAVVVVLGFVLTVLVSHAQQKPSIAALKTKPESTDYKSTSTYDDVVTFMKAVDEASPIIFYTTYGTTFEGRAMPMAVVGTGLKDASPASVKASGKLRVHIQANVHAGEVEGKESCLVLLREFALGQHRDWLQSMVFLVTPIYNADGNEKFALNNRQRQNGPVNGMGTRANAQNLNINRDYMKLDTPEAKAFVKLWNDYDPYVGYDLHTSDGSAHGYYLTYSPPLNPDTTGPNAHLQDETQFLTDLQNNRLPAVSFIKFAGIDNEHPGYTDVVTGQQHVADIVNAVQNSNIWHTCAIIVTYDENGGRWDHVAPPVRSDGWGTGVRVPAIIISPLARSGYVDHTQYETVSILKLLEFRFNLAPLSGRDADPAVNDLVNAFGQ